MPMEKCSCVRGAVNQVGKTLKLCKRAGALVCLKNDGLHVFMKISNT